MYKKYHLLADKLKAYITDAANSNWQAISVEIKFNSTLDGNNLLSIIAACPPSCQSSGNQKLID